MNRFIFIVPVVAVCVWATFVVCRGQSPATGPGTAPAFTPGSLPGSVPANGTVSRNDGNRLAIAGNKAEHQNVPSTSKGVPLPILYRSITS